MKIKNLPDKFKPIWKKAEPLLKKSRPGDDAHAADVIGLILNYKGSKKIDLDILIPVAIIHDIGHSAILPEHFKYVSGSQKIPNAKLVHMLTGAKIAKDILDSVDYDKNKSKEIIDIISIHDADQLKGVDTNKFYNTENKKIFHDFDCLDRYTEKRIMSMKSLAPNREELLKKFKNSLSSFFYDEFRQIAEKRLQNLEKF